MSGVKPARRKVIVENLSKAMHQFPALAELPPDSLLSLMRLILSNRNEVDSLGGYVRRNKQAVDELTAEDVEEAFRPFVAKRILDA